MNLGSVVQLKSGSPSMTVDAIDQSGKHITCLWFSEDNLNYATFPEKALLRQCEACLGFFNQEAMKSDGDWCAKCYLEYVEDHFIEQMIDIVRGK